MLSRYSGKTCSSMLSLLSACCQGATEDRRQQSNRHGCGTFVANTTMVCQTAQTDDRRTSGNGSNAKHVDTARQARQRASSEEKADPTSKSFIGKDLQERHISEAAAKIIPP